MPDDDRITKSPVREIISDFVNEINNKKTQGAKPSVTTIDFRNERKLGIERPIWFIGSEFLRLRRENGRIISDVYSYENSTAKLLDNSIESQNEIKKIINRKDPEMTATLKKSIKATEQREPAIITCDGFLINGNRRKVVIDELFDETHEDRFKTIKVVILPGENDEGGPPTIKEIQKIERRYQLQSDGKSDYSGLDKAILMRDDIEINGMSLKEQLIDDPLFASLDKTTLNREIKKHNEKYIEPLRCVDDYLHMLNRDNQYDTISTGIGDKEGRWQAFIDYYNKVKKNLMDEKNRIKLFGVEEKDIGNIEEIAFKIIRKRSFKDLPKLHQLMRTVPKMIKHPNSKKELDALLSSVEMKLDSDEALNKDGSEANNREKDRIWGKKYEEEFQRRLKNAQKIILYKQERDTPMSLLNEALKKLKHKEMDIASVPLSEISDFMQLCRDIARLSTEIESEAYHIDKNSLKDLKNKFS
jgi:hypothetical protein